MKNLSGFTVAAVACAVLASSASAAPVTINFARVTPANSSQNIAGQLSAVLTDVTATQVTFQFLNNVGVQSSISEVYFDTSNVFTGMATLTQVGTSFAAGPANPGNLPGGNNLTPPFVANQIYSADAQGNPSNGVNLASDSLTMTFNLAPGVSYSNLVAAINNGSFRVGLHVRAIGTDGQSDSFANFVPTPGAAALLGLAGIVGVRRRRA